MSELGGSSYFILIGLVTLIGVLGTVVYYFARYYVKDSDQQELQEDNHIELVSKSEVSESELAATAEESGSNSPPVAMIAGDKTLAQTPPPSPTPQTVSAAEDSTKTQQNLSLSAALSKTKNRFLSGLTELFGVSGSLNTEDFEALEEILYTSDIGGPTVQRLLSTVEQNLKPGEKKDLQKVREVLRQEMLSILTGVDEATSPTLFTLQAGIPAVIMVVGVNGVGKTTTIGKLSQYFSQKNLKTMVVAGDTYRAAAGEQLEVWGRRSGVEVFNPLQVKDPSAVAFDACEKAMSQKFEVIILDTAGRLHTQKNLMEELKKIKRVVKKVLPQQPQETLLVLDANSGQNAMIQAKSFQQALELTGVILTKLDGTAKGGVALGLAGELALPIKMVGVGEGIADLRPFDSKEFINSII